MKFTALEIKQQTFEKSFRGYDENEVKAFLNVVSLEWEMLVGKMRDLERDNAQLKDKIKHFERVEEALHDTLQTAKETAEQRISGAKREAQSRLEKAELEADGILREAQNQRQAIRQDIQRLAERRDEIVRGIRSYLDMASASLNAFAKDEAGVFAVPVAAAEPKAAKPTKAEAAATASAADLDAILDSI